MSKKNILITVPEDIIARNIFFTDFWPEFSKSSKEDVITIVVPEEKRDFYDKIFKAQNISVIGFKRKPAGKLENLIMTLARSGIKSNTNLWSKMRSRYRGDSSFFDTYFKRFLTFTLGGFDWYKTILRSLILKTPHDQNVLKIFNELKPDILISTSLTNFEFDVLIAKSARKLGIPIIGMVRSWDNLSSHGLLRVVPDILLLQNEFLKEMAHKYQGKELRRVPIIIFGLPHYDKYFNADNFLKDKKEFFEMFGLNPNKKTILYCGMGELLFKREADLIDIFEDLVNEKKLSSDLQIIYSAHPKFLSSLEKLKDKKHILAAPKISYKSEGANSWELQLENNLRLIKLIKYVDVLVMGASSMAIDAATLDKPVICVGFDGNSKSMNYWESVARFYDTYTHFEELLKAGGLVISWSKDELAEHVNRYLKNSSLEKEGRKKIIERFVAPFDGKSGIRLAKEVYAQVVKNIKN